MNMFRFAARFLIAFALAIPAAHAQTPQSYNTVPSIAALKAMTNRPQVVEVVDANPGIFNMSQGACSAADDVFQVQPTSGSMVCYTRAATPYAAGKGSATSVLTSNGTLPSWSSTLPAVTANAAVATATGSTAARSLADRFGQQVNVLDFVGVDPTGATDSITGFNAALATGKNVLIPQGTYTITADWMKMQTANQRLLCDGATINVVKPAGTTVSPAIIVYPTAVGARVEGCYIDQNGAQFSGDFPQIPLAPLNTSLGNDAPNASLGTTILVMADRAQVNNTWVKRGWNTCVGFGIYDLTTGAQSQGPIGGLYLNGTTEQCGQGLITGIPNYREGTGFDNFLGLGIQVTGGTDYGSQVGVYLDTGGSSTVVNGFTCYNTQISPVIAGTWQNTIGGDCLVLGGQNRLFDGNTWTSLGPTIVNNLWSYQPMRHCVHGFPEATGAILSNIHCVMPGLEGIRMHGGVHKMSNVWIDQANYLRGNTSVPPGTAAEQTNALQVNANSAGYLSSLYWNTNVVINGLNITGGSSPQYGYAIGMASSGGNTPRLKVTGDNQILAGASGLFTGTAISRLNLNGTARSWTPIIFGGTTPGTSTYYEQTGYYWQIENTTYLTFNVATSGFGGGAGTINIGGLPVTSGGGSGDAGYCNITMFNNYNFPSTYSIPGGIVAASNTTINMVESGDSLVLQYMDMANATANGFRLAGTCSYRN